MTSPYLSEIRKTANRRLLQLDRWQKRLLKITADSLIIWISLLLAFMLRLDDLKLVEPLGEHFWLFVMAPIVSIPVFFIRGFYRSVMRYSGVQASTAIFEGATIASILLGILIYIGPVDSLVPRSIIFIYWLLSLVMLGGLRLLMRRFFSYDAIALTALIPFLRISSPARDSRTPVLIYGAGHSGNQLLSAIRMGSDMRVVGFLDDNPALVGRIIGGVQIFNPRDTEKIIERFGAKEVLLAIPSASRRRRIQVIEMLAPIKIMVRTIPGMMDLVSGKITASDLREVDIADLLGRDSVAPNADLFEQCVKNQVVLVTGAGGSIGSELCRQIVQLKPTVLILYEHSEFALYSIHQEVGHFVRNMQLLVKIVPLLGSILNHRALYNTMSAWHVDTVYHAAAYKHVPMVEHNIAAGTMNNIFGTLHTAQAAIRAQVKNFVLISTDKAVRPTNIMGSTKRLAELVLQALATEKEPILFGARELGRFSNNTRFTMVRFGNVLGSSGSVIPLFREQIRKSGPVTVTHPEITRYFMTIPEAAQLVIQAGSMGTGGDVFVLDMGEPIKIAELAAKMVLLSGLSVKSDADPDGDIEIRFTGLRPGEKLYEELLIGANVTETGHPKIQRANELYTEWEPLKGHLKVLFNCVQEYNYLGVREIFGTLVEGFKPDEEFVDWEHERQADLRSHVQLPEFTYPMIPFVQMEVATVAEHVGKPSQVNDLVGVKTLNA